MKKISILGSKNLVAVFLLTATFTLSSHQSFSRNLSSETPIVKADSSVDSQTAVVKNSIDILNNEGMHGMARIYLQTGKRISETLLYKGTNTIDVSSLPAGMYIVCITMDGGARFNQKFIKQ